MNAPTSSNPAPDAADVSPATQVSATAAAVPSLSRQALLARIGLLGIAAAALVAATLLVVSTSAAPNGTLAAGSTSGTTSAPVDMLRGRGPGFMGGHFGLAGITITAINGNDISLKTEDGWTRTITVDSGTTYEKADATIAQADLKVGDQIGFRQTLESDGSWSIDSVVVILPHTGGEVTKIDGSTITVSRRDGSTSTITVNAQTKYSVNGDDGAALADVEVGMFLVAEGSKNSDGSLTASLVKAANISTFEGRGGRFGHDFRFGPGADGNGGTPDSSAAPSASGTAS